MASNSANRTPRNRRRIPLIGILICCILASLGISSAALTLFVVDVIWIKHLSKPGIRVMLVNPKEVEQEQTETAKW